VGDVTEAELMELVQAQFGGWEARDVPPVAAPSARLPEKRRMELIDRNLTQATLILGHVGIQRNNPDYYAVVVMNYILGGGGFSSRLLKKIRDEQGLVYGIVSHFDARVHPGSFEVSLQTKTATADEATAGVLAEIERIRRERVTAQELAEAKDFLVGSFPLRMETNTRMAGLLAQVEFYGLGLDYFNDYPEKIKAVTADDVLRVAQSYLHPDKLTLVAVGHQPELTLTFE
jgi:zinc protease